MNKALIALAVLFCANTSVQAQSSDSVSVHSGIWSYHFVLDGISDSAAVKDVAAPLRQWFDELPSFDEETGKFSITCSRYVEANELTISLIPFGTEVILWLREEQITAGEGEQ